jgi:cytochrome c oxidase subunit 4
VSEHADDASAAPPPGGQHLRAPSARPLVFTLFALLFLAALSLVLSRFDLGGLNVPLALGIAVVKVVLVAVFFMEILHETAATHLAIGACLTLFALLVALLLADIVTRTVPPLDPPPGNAQRARG